MQYARRLYGGGRRYLLVSYYQAITNAKDMTIHRHPSCNVRRWRLQWFFHSKGSVLSFYGCNLLFVNPYLQVHRCWGTYGAKFAPLYSCSVSVNFYQGDPSRPSRVPRSGFLQTRTIHQLGWKPVWWSDIDSGVWIWKADVPREALSRLCDLYCCCFSALRFQHQEGRQCLRNAWWLSIHRCPHKVWLSLLINDMGENRRADHLRFSFLVDPTHSLTRSSKETEKRKISSSPTPRFYEPSFRSLFI